jgi:hypothetical protein
MSKKWRIIFGVVIVIGIIAFIFGLKLPASDDFLKNFLASLAAAMLVLAIGICLIEGPLMTREQRLSKIVAIAARSVAQLNEEIALMLVREIGEYLASKLDSNIDLDGEERGNWTAFKRLLRLVFQDARQVPIKGLPKSEPLSEEDYLSYIASARSFMIRVHSAIGTDREVQAQLLELMEHWNKLNAHLTEAGYPYKIKDEKMRYATLAAIGDTLIDLIEACPKIKG